MCWTTHTTAEGKTSQQQLFFLQTIKKATLPQQIMVTLYRCSIESILTYCIPAADRKALQHVLSNAQRIIRTQLPVLEEVYTTRCLRIAISICEDPTHLCHYLFELLPSGRHYKALRSHTTRLKNSFYPRAVLKLYYGRSSVFTVSAFLSFTLWVSKYIYKLFLGTRHEAAAFSNCAIRFSSYNTCFHPKGFMIYACSARVIPLCKMMGGIQNEHIQNVLL